MQISQELKKFTDLYRETSVSLKIIVLMLVLFSSVISAGYIAVSQLKVFKHDAVSINQLGIIRGSIQRITKLELESIDSKDIVKQVDEYFLKLSFSEFVLEPVESVSHQKDLQLKISTLRDDWSALKHLLNNKDLPNYEKNLIKQSEICWETANLTVLAAQKLSENKHLSYRSKLSIIIFVIGLFILIIIALVYKVVHISLEQDVLTDPLTRLFNRNYFDKIIHKQVKLHQRGGGVFSLLLCDVDYFKAVNDEFGHQHGDYVLRQLAELLLVNSREYDYVFRYGGEEIALIFPNSNLKQATKIAEKYRALISKQNFSLGRPLTVSIGVAQIENNESAEALFKRADNALYQAKAEGRNRVICENNQVELNV